jgi:hypothetical protein
MNGLPESLPFQNGATCRAGGSVGNVGTCYPGDVNFLPVPGPPWDKTMKDIPNVQSFADVPAWCGGPMDGVLQRR